MCMMFYVFSALWMISFVNIWMIAWCVLCRLYDVLMFLYEVWFCYVCLFNFVWLSYVFLMMRMLFLCVLSELFDVLMCCVEICAIVLCFLCDVYDVLMCSLWFVWLSHMCLFKCVWLSKVFLCYVYDVLMFSLRVVRVSYVSCSNLYDCLMFSVRFKTSSYFSEMCMSLFCCLFKCVWLSYAFLCDLSDVLKCSLWFVCVLLCVFKFVRLAYASVRFECCYYVFSASCMIVLGCCSKL